ncbi:hypothetical protein D3C79_890660 [compost metagenome]
MRTAAVCRYVALVGDLRGRDRAAVVVLAERRQVKGGAGQRLRRIPVWFGNEIAPAGGAVTGGQPPGKGVGAGVQIELVPAGWRLLIQFEEGALVGAGDMAVCRTVLREAFQAFDALRFVLHAAALGIELQLALVRTAGRRFDIAVGASLLRYAKQGGAQQTEGHKGTGSIVHESLLTEVIL